MDLALYPLPLCTPLIVWRLRPRYLPAWVPIERKITSTTSKCSIPVIGEVTWLSHELPAGDGSVSHDPGDVGGEDHQLVHTASRDAEVCDSCTSGESEQGITLHWISQSNRYVIDTWVHDFHKEHFSAWDDSSRLKSYQLDCTVYLLYFFCCYGSACHVCAPTRWGLYICSSSTAAPAIVSLQTCYVIHNLHNHMYSHPYIYIHTYIHCTLCTWTHTHTYTCTHMHTFTSPYVHTYTCMHTYAYIYIHYMHIKYTHMLIIRIHAHAHIAYIHMLIYTQTYMHIIHIHTHHTYAYVHIIRIHTHHAYIHTTHMHTYTLYAYIHMHIHSIPQGRSWVRVLESCTGFRDVWSQLLWY